jgi:hypothetical protein
MKERGRAAEICSFGSNPETGDKKRNEPKE